MPQKKGQPSQRDVFNAVNSKLKPKKNFKFGGPNSSYAAFPSLWTDFL